MLSILNRHLEFSHVSGNFSLEKALSCPKTIKYIDFLITMNKIRIGDL